MIKPYFQTELGRLYHGDCLEIIPDLGSVDIVLADPPYGMDYQSSRRTDKNLWKKKIHGDKEYPLWIFDLKPEVALFACCRWDNLYEIPKPTSLIVWDKMVHSMGNLNHEFGRQWEAIAFYPQKNHFFVKRPKDLIRCPKIPAEKLLHPNQKPIALFRPILQSHMGSVLDPFFGSGTIGIICERFNRKYIGVEISEEYCEIAARRIERETQQLKLNFGG